MRSSSSTRRPGPAGDVPGHRQRRRRVGRGLRRGRPAARRRARRGRHRAQHQLPERRQGRAPVRDRRRGGRRRSPRPSARATDLPLLVKLSPNVADVRPIARAIEEAGADAITADQHAVRDGRSPGPAPAAPRQHLRRPVRPGDQAGRPAGRLRGRPGRATSRSWPSAACPSCDDVLDFLAVGAVAVQVGTAIFADPTLPVRLVDELAAECRRRGLASYRDADRHGPAEEAGAPRRRASSTGP